MRRILDEWKIRRSLRLRRTLGGAQSPGLCRYRHRGNWPQIHERLRDLSEADKQTLNRITAELNELLDHLNNALAGGTDTH